MRGKLVDPLKLTIPDLWHIAGKIRNDVEREEVLETWYMCHNLLRHITGQDFIPPRNITSEDFQKYHARWLKAEVASNKKAVKK